MVHVHGRYTELRPKAVHVLSVRNATLRLDLDKYRLISRLQEAIAGATEMDVLSELRSSVEEEFTARGFEPSSESEGPGIGVVEVFIEDWTDAPASRASSIRARYRLVLTLPQSGETLYSTTVHCHMESRGSAFRRLTATELRAEIRRSVRSALNQLPQS